MIYKTNLENFYAKESYKERNLYYKIFSGYLFNELVTDSNKSREAFFDLLQTNNGNDELRKGNRQDIEKFIIDFVKKEFAVTFDFHSAQIIKNDKINDRGEMSDVLLISDKQFISIECKYLSNMSFEKDILEVQARIKKVSKKLALEPIQILLMKKSKWDHSRATENKKTSFFKAFHKKTSSIPVIIVFWEDLLKIISSEEVKNYLSKQLSRIK